MILSYRTSIDGVFLAFWLINLWIGASKRQFYSKLRIGIWVAFIVTDLILTFISFTFDSCFKAGTFGDQSVTLKDDNTCGIDQLFVVIYLILSKYAVYITYFRSVYLINYVGSKDDGDDRDLKIQDVAKQFE